MVYATIVQHQKLLDALVTLSNQKPGDVVRSRELLMVRSCLVWQWVVAGGRGGAWLVTAQPQFRSFCFNPPRQIIWTIWTAILAEISCHPSTLC